LPMLNHRYGVLKDLDIGKKDKPQAGTFPQSVFRFSSNIFGYIYIILPLRKVTPMLDPGLMNFGELETWAAVGREFVFCQHCSGLTTQIICS
jgi:hypothetical protein